MITIQEDKNDELANKIATIMTECGSDKQTSHNYSHGYSYFLSRLESLDNINFLEIGIANIEPDKSSLHGWAKIFYTATIYGIDIVPEKMINTDRIKTFVANQSSVAQLSAFRDAYGYPKFDVILDDGSHHFTDAAVSFGYFIGCLKKNGIYMIEDIRKTSIPGQQNVIQWQEFLSQYDMIDFEIVDCRPDLPEDDSVLIGIWRK